MTDDVLGTPTNPDQATDEPLGAAPEFPEVEDITNDVAPEDFDFDAFVDGVRPGRRAVRVTMRSDLVGEIDQLAIQAEELSDPNGEEAQALYDRFEEIKEQIAASQRTFVVEGRSDHRRRQIAKQMEKLGYQKPGKKASEDEIVEWNQELALRTLVDGIIVPSNVTLEGLRKLNEIADAEVNKLFGAFSDASTSPAKNINPNFLHRR